MQNPKEWWFRPADCPARHGSQAAGPVPSAEPGHHRLAWRLFTHWSIAVLLAVLILRTFVTEAFVVPSGSMAPTLLGWHKRVTCPSCRFPFELGCDEHGRVPATVSCPNCEWADFELGDLPVSAGDRLVVEKHVFASRAPHRWEPIVFRGPMDPNQAYVKRVVGLPGESIQLRQGDVWIDGRLARKTLTEMRALRQIVFDNDYAPSDDEWQPRWIYAVNSAWRSDGSEFYIPGQAAAAAQSDGGSRRGIDWIEYRPWSRVLGDDLIRARSGYNGDTTTEFLDPVRDLIVEFEATLMGGDGQVYVRITDGSSYFLLRCGPPGEVVVERNGMLVRSSRTAGSSRRAAPGQTTPVAGVPPPLGSGRLPEPVDDARAGAGSQRLAIEVALCDGRLCVAIDGQEPFEPYDYEPRAAVASPRRPVAIGRSGSAVRLSHLRIYRDVYYTACLDGRAGVGRGVDRPFAIGPGEYFVLGDNSPISNDSRFWAAGPWPAAATVPAQMLLGRPLLVHLPTVAVRQQVLGRDVRYSIPDFRRVRYIR
jgi:signal peptidase I